MFENSRTAPQSRRFPMPFSFRRDNEDALNQAVTNNYEVEIVFGEFGSLETRFKGKIQTNLDEEMWLEIFSPSKKDMEKAEEVFDTHRSFSMTYRDWEGKKQKLLWTSPHSHRFNPPNPWHGFDHAAGLWH